jgi:hypothetical protein
MYPHVIQFETRQLEIERLVQLHEERRRARASSQPMRSYARSRPVLTRLVPRLADRGKP